MKTILPIIICLCLSCSALCQPGFMRHSNKDYGFGGTLLADQEPIPADSLDSELTRVYYEYTYNGKNKITGEWLLQVGVNTTRFLPVGRYKADSIQRLRPRNYPLFGQYVEDGDLFHYFDSYCVSNDNCRFACRFGVDDIMYEETLPAIDWELQDSVANICGYQCRSARGTFRGRTYFVFYAEDIPVSAGPWKLRGLPGLILHADADDGKFVFHASQVGPPTGALIHWQKHPYIKVNRRQYERMLTQMQQNYTVAIASHLARNPNIVFRHDPSVTYPDLSWVEQLEIE